MSNRPNGVFKTTNEYQECISRELYEKAPKAVLAAIAVSLMVNFVGKDLSEIDEALIEEWATLNRNGLVPQKAPNLKTTQTAHP